MDGDQTIRMPRFVDGAVLCFDDRGVFPVARLSTYFADFASGRFVLRR